MIKWAVKHTNGKYYNPKLYYRFSSIPYLYKSYGHAINASKKHTGTFVEEFIIIEFPRLKELDKLLSNDYHKQSLHEILEEARKILGEIMS